MMLFAGSALATLSFPIFVKAYDYRFVIPAFGPLFVAGVLAAWGLVGRIRTDRRAARLLHRA
jgi:hypothetical protein